LLGLAYKSRRAEFASIKTLHGRLFLFWRQAASDEYRRSVQPTQILTTRRARELDAYLERYPKDRNHKFIEATRDLAKKITSRKASSQ
jgi:uridine kinase